MGRKSFGQKLGIKYYVNLKNLDKKVFGLKRIGPSWPRTKMFWTKSIWQNVIQDIISLAKFMLDKNILNKSILNKIILNEALFSHCIMGNTSWNGISHFV